MNIYKLQNGIIKSGLIRINRTVPILFILIFLSGQVCNADVVSKQLSDYSVIEERNIFAPPRAPSPVTLPPEVPVVEDEPTQQEEVPARKVKEVDGMLLTGIVFFDNKFHVLLEDKATSKGAILSAGEMIKGVSIINIEEGKVLLQKAEEKLEMVLDRKSKEISYPPGMRGPASLRGGSGPPPAYIPPSRYQSMPPGTEGMPPGMMLPEETQ